MGNWTPSLLVGRFDEFEACRRVPLAAVLVIVQAMNSLLFRPSTLLWLLSSLYLDLRARKFRCEPVQSLFLWHFPVAIAR